MPPAGSIDRGGGAVAGGERELAAPVDRASETGIRGAACECAAEGPTEATDRGAAIRACGAGEACDGGSTDSNLLSAAGRAP